MNDRMTSIVARIIFILRVKVVIPTVMAILPISSSSKVTVRTLNVT
jgi:hypothetical protein